MIIQVFFKNLYGKTSSLNIDEHAKISELLQLAKESTKFALIHTEGYKDSPIMEVYLNSLKYIYAGKQLNDCPDATLSDINMSKESTFHQTNPFSNAYKFSFGLLCYEKLMNSG